MSNDLVVIQNNYLATTQSALDSAYNALVPAAPEELSRFVGEITGPMNFSNIPSPEIFIDSLTKLLARYPKVVIEEAMLAIHDKVHWAAIPDITDICKKTNERLRARVRFLEEEVRYLKELVEKNARETAELEEAFFRASGRRLNVTEITAILSAIDEIAPDDTQREYFRDDVEKCETWIPEAVDYFLELHAEQQKPSWPRSAGKDHPRIAAWKRYCMIRRGMTVKAKTPEEQTDPGTPSEAVAS